MSRSGEDWLVDREIETQTLISIKLQNDQRGLLCPWDSPGKNTRVDCHFLLQGIFPTQGSSPGLLHLLHYRQILYRWATEEAPLKRVTDTLLSLQEPSFLREECYPSFRELPMSFTKYTVPLRLPMLASHPSTAFRGRWKVGQILAVFPRICLYTT